MTTSSTKACVIGWPIRHSRSPMIHGHWLDKYGVDGSYEKVAIAPEELTDFIAHLASYGYRGCNVTVPHKEDVFRLLDVADPTAQAVGAANTLWLENGRLCGANTDVAGFLANLDAGAPGWDRTPIQAVVLGAGGAGRAVAYALKSRGSRSVALVNRTPDRARDVAEVLGEPISAHGWAELPDLLRTATLLVNATSLGMKGSLPLEIDLEPLATEAVVADIVYVPLETDLLAGARRRGNRTVDGLGMLLHQAVPGFEKWFGIRPTVTPELRARIVADIMAEQQR